MSFGKYTRHLINEASLQSRQRGWSKLFSQGSSQQIKARLDAHKKKPDADFQKWLDSNPHHAALHSQTKAEMKPKAHKETKAEKEARGLAAWGGSGAEGTAGKTLAIKAQGAGAPKVYSDPEKKEYAAERGLGVSSGGDTTTTKTKDSPLVAALKRSAQQKKLKQKEKESIADTFTSPEREDDTVEVGHGSIKAGRLGEEANVADTGEEGQAKRDLAQMKRELGQFGESVETAAERIDEIDMHTLGTAAAVVGGMAAQEVAGDFAKRLAKKHIINPIKDRLHDIIQNRNAAKSRKSNTLGADLYKRKPNMGTFQVRAPVHEPPPGAKRLEEAELDEARKIPMNYAAIKAAALKKKQKEEREAAKKAAAEKELDEASMVGMPFTPAEKERMKKLDAADKAKTKEVYQKGEKVTIPATKARYSTNKYGHGTTNEEVEQVDELDRSTVASYLGKAGTSLKTKQRMSDLMHSAADKSAVAYQKKGGSTAYHSYQANKAAGDRFSSAAANRIKGIATAGKKLADTSYGVKKEEAELEEARKIPMNYAAIKAAALKKKQKEEKEAAKKAADNKDNLEEAEPSEYLNSKITEARQIILNKLADKMGKK